MKLKKNAIPHRTGRKTNLALLLFFLPAVAVMAQTTQTQVNPSAVPEFPQWAKDLRRWEIVAFGSFPFTILTATMAVDTKRWIDANGMDFSDEGRRYAPWPLKSAGAVDMTRDQQVQTVLIAAGLSAAIAFTDFAIIQIKRDKERKRNANLPAGTTIINTQPWPTIDEIPIDDMPHSSPDGGDGANPEP